MNITALKSSNFRAYLFGNVFTVNAVWMFRVAIGWLAWELTESASYVGFIAFLYYSPTIVSSPLVGVLIDRVNVRTAAKITQGLQLGLAIVLSVLVQFSLLNTIVLAVFTVTAGTMLAAHHPVRMSLTPRLVTQQQLSSVVNMVAINFNLGRMTGPAIGGWLIASIGIQVTLLIIAACYLPFQFVLLKLNIRARQNTAQMPEPFFTSLLVGVRYIARRPMVRQAVLVTGMSAFFVRGVLELLPVLADGKFAKGASGLGQLTSAAGVGALLAGILIAVLPPQAGRRLPPATFFVAFCGLCLVPVFGRVGDWPMALMVVAALGFAATMTAIRCQTAIQLDLGDGMRGRVMSLWSAISIGSAAVGAAVVGYIADMVGLPWSTLLTGGLAILLFVVYWYYGASAQAYRD